MLILGLAVLILSVKTSLTRKGRVPDDAFDNTLSPSPSLPDNQPIRQLTIPGTHDSGTYPGYGGVYAKCQSWSLTDRYLAGIRFVDIRCRSINDTFRIHHGIFYQRLMFTDIMRDTINFLTEHPSETIFMHIKEEYTEKASSKTFDEILIGYLKPWGSNIWTNTRWPRTLGDIRGKVVIITRHDSSSIGLDDTDLNVEDHYSSTPSSKLGYVKAHLDEVSCNTGGYLTFASAFWYPAFAPKHMASFVNPRTMQYISGLNKTCLGFVVMDFPGASLVGEIIDINFMN